MWRSGVFVEVFVDGDQVPNFIRGLNGNYITARQSNCLPDSHSGSFPTVRFYHNITNNKDIPSAHWLTNIACPNIPQSADVYLCCDATKSKAQNIVIVSGEDKRYVALKHYLEKQTQYISHNRPKITLLQLDPKDQCWFSKIPNMGTRFCRYCGFMFNFTQGYQSHHKDVHDKDVLAQKVPT